MIFLNVHNLGNKLLLDLLFGRCHALNFHPSKTHKKTLKRVNKFLSKGEMPVERCDEGHEGERVTLTKEPALVVIHNNIYLQYIFIMRHFDI